MKLNHIILTLAVLLLTSGMVSIHACSCVSNSKWTLKKELGLVDIAIKGTIISVTDYTDSSFPWQYKLFRLIVEKKYKSPITTSDTVSIITGRDGGSCGYGFKIGKEYIVYGSKWTRKKTTRKTDEDNSHNIFYTDICFLTKEANAKELAQLKRLTR